MSVVAQKWAWDQNLPDRPKFVLVTMADQADSQTGHVRYQRTDTQFFVQKCNISERSFYRSVAALVRNGYMTRESGREQGDEETQYWLCLDREPTAFDTWSWGNEAHQQEAEQESGLTQGVDESATMADQKPAFESARVVTDELPSVAEQESFDSPKITRRIGKTEKTDFSKTAQDIDRGSLPSGWYDRRSREARAIGTLCHIVNEDHYFHDIMGGQTSIRYPQEITPQLLVLATAPPRSEWTVIVEQRQVAAWFNFAVEYLPNRRIKLRGPCKVPWPWPPKKAGVAYDDVPSNSLADERCAEIKSHVA